MAIQYVIGDLFNQQKAGDKILIHVCNDTGGWGAGFVVALSKMYPSPEVEYRKLALAKGLKLGLVQFVEVRSTPGDVLHVGNMVAQRSTRMLSDGSADGCPPIRYPALLKCLEEVAAFATKNKLAVIAPKFGAGLAGGKWKLIEIMMKEVFRDLDVTIYELSAVAPDLAVAAPVGSQAPEIL